MNMEAKKKVKAMDIMRKGLEELILSHGFKKSSKKRGMYLRLHGDVLQELMFDTFRVPYIIRMCVCPIWNVDIERLSSCYLLRWGDIDITDLVDKIEGYDDINRYHAEPSYRRWEHCPGDADSIGAMVKLAYEKMEQYIFPLLDRISDDESALRFKSAYSILRGKRMHIYLKEHPVCTDIYRYLLGFLQEDILFNLSPDDTDFDKLTENEKYCLSVVYSNVELAALAAITENTQIIDNRLWYYSMVISRNPDERRAQVIAERTEEWKRYTTAKDSGMSKAGLIDLLKKEYESIRSKKNGEIQAVLDELKIPIVLPKQ